MYFINFLKLTCVNNPIFGVWEKIEKDFKVWPRLCEVIPFVNTRKYACLNFANMPEIAAWNPSRGGPPSLDAFLVNRPNGQQCLANDLRNHTNLSITSSPTINLNPDDAVWGVKMLLIPTIGSSREMFKAFHRKLLPVLITAVKPLSIPIDEAELSKM